MSIFQGEKTFTNNEGENKQETFESCTLNSQSTLHANKTRKNQMGQTTEHEKNVLNNLC